MNSKTKKIVIISSVIATLGVILGIIIWKSKKTITTNVDPATGNTIKTNIATQEVTITTPAGQTSTTVLASPWVPFDWVGGNAPLSDKIAYAGIHLNFDTNNATIFNYVKSIKIGSKIEVKVDSGDTSYNGTHTVIWKGEDVNPEDYKYDLLTIDVKKINSATGKIRLVS